jgi:hypothetical protein
VKKLLCIINGHKFKLLRQITNTVRELKCERCGKEFSHNDDTLTALPLDAKLKEMDDSLLRTVEINKKLAAKGQVLYELDLSTMEFSECELVTAKPGHLYCLAINRTNAERKFKNMLAK